MNGSYVCTIGVRVSSFGTCFVSPQESADRALGTPGWAEAAQRDGITVWKKYFPKDEYGYQYPCVKARGVITGSAEEVMGMIIDSTRVLEYNR